MIIPIALLVLVLIAPATDAHVPLISKGNENIPSATWIDDPEKSWAVYGQLRPDVPQYYGFYMKKDERIYLSLLTSTNPQEKDFSPGMALMGPGISPKGALPDSVSLPEGFGSMAIEGIRAEQATYEPFGPSSYYRMAELDLVAPESGNYYAAVYAGTAGHYSLGIGYKEEFSFMERITTPVLLLSVYRWEGQEMSTIMMPWIVAALAGLFILMRSPRKTPYRTAGTMAAFLFIGTSASILSQMIFSLTRASAGQEAAITLILALFPAVLGVLTLRLAAGEAGILQRTLLAVIGTIALLAGSGLIIGPLLAIAASVLPSRKKSEL